MLWSHTRVRILLLHKNFCKTENTFFAHRMLLLLCSTSTCGTTMVMSRLSPLNRLCLCEEWRWFSTNSENSNILNRTFTFLLCSYCESMKRWSLPDKKADGVTVINFMQIFPEPKLTRRELDPKLWGMSGIQQQHIIWESQSDQKSLNIERSYLKESVQRFETGSFWNYNRDRDRRLECLK